MTTHINNALALPLDQVRVQCNIRVVTNRAFPSLWDNLPIVVNYASDWDAVEDDQEVGRLYSLTKSKDGIWGKALIDVRRLSDYAPEVAERLWNGRAVEVSAVTEVDLDAVPEHLAILPDGRDGMALRDGCYIHRVRNTR